MRWSRRVRASARGKVVQAVQDAVAPEADRRHSELIDLITGQAKTIADLQESITTLEFRMRRDIPFASDLEATASSADFVEDHLPRTPSFTRPDLTLRHALGAVSNDGMALEFGVATGTTLAIIVDEWRRAANVGVIAGFDTFEGLPEDWRTGFEAGTFAQDALPDVPGAHLVKGMFQQTLGPFLSKNRGPVAFLHLDADLYSSTDFVLRRLESRLVPGTVIVFDEFFNFPGWALHEYKAWTEFVHRTGVTFEYLAYTSNNEQVAVKLT
ncbi:class I SAM-dependent methyltransferase [Rhodococcus sp. BP-149]|uniref:class I SAM-dependent methyltransferase n=1 Tax=unclassified Rhodococcus (in: high G+C Gram-positive bacteria) TaxID=192944 RepID=UPI001C9A516A|nr:MULTISPECIES: class I SAM-dependent methyltransferase [unclassified Rhodococcus (in: high G+C Gram-positive bacteria)]MBY6687702.1 class I SAM-dependent methyltransferase [Rhodococcus sp. BP-288]MBY6695857.1 class I SAM-dependent methyltransferase [Rhodococcus sp. BP-188]MBY6700335.1 class I SAM-dependent methyltransferase [Rhodococcus sp. BP-285]MBY6704642.1 class I SAM-dependent methyltransferase [Rhodococcus sp. BP-283]MBY6713460.1 class I SAM-dependent methyltransferase [Rhodococcus sp.